MDENTKASVQAHLISIGRSDAIVEKIVSRISFEPGVTAVSWKISPSVV